MNFIKRITTTSLILILLIPLVLPGQKVHAAVPSAYQTFNQNLSKELNRYIKGTGGTITLHYRDFTTGDEYKINSYSPKKAASTIKLPLALYVMELAAAKRINLNEKLTYKRHHYYGGSGVIQKQKLGTSYTIRDLVKKAMVHSDNIAFIMLRERVGKNNFIAYMKRIGGKNAYPKGQNLTSSSDLVVYAKRLYNFSRGNSLGKELVGYLKNTDYNTTIPKGIKGVPVAHKVGMIPMSRIYNDIGIVYDKHPFALAVTTNNLSYDKSQKVIANIAGIVYKHHKIKNKVSYFQPKSATAVYPIPVASVKSIGIVARGEAYRISADKGEWYEVRYGDKKGYIPKNTSYAYSKPPIVGFMNGVLANNGLVTSKGASKVLSKPGTNRKVIFTLNKGTSITINSLKGNYYTSFIGNRIGYIHKNNVQLQFTSAVRSFQIKQDNADLYSLRNGVYVHKGNLQKGRIFTILKDAGSFVQVQFGTEIAYVKKASANPLFNAVAPNPAVNQSAAGVVTLNEETVVYTNTIDSPPYSIGKIAKGQKISYTKLENGWYEINFLGRKGYFKLNDNTVN